MDQIKYCNVSRTFPVSMVTVFLRNFPADGTISCVPGKRMTMLLSRHEIDTASYIGGFILYTQHFIGKSS